MSTLLYATLFATVAIAANVTTSVWLPGAANANQTFLGSVIQQDGDNTVLALSYANPPQTPDYFRSAPDRATVGGTTRVIYTVSGSDSAGNPAAKVTVAVDCTRQSEGISAVPTCTASTVGAGPALSAVCAGLTLASLPDYCTASDAQTFDQTLTFSGESQYYLNNFQLIITAGTEKLAASAAATPSALSASVTGAGAVSGSGMASNGAASSQTMASASGSAQQATGAAAPMNTIAPVIAGLGAAAAAFFL